MASSARSRWIPNFLKPRRTARRNLEYDGGAIIAKDRVPASGTSRVRWGQAIQVPLHPAELPPVPVALAVRMTLREGYAGCGWYDEDGTRRGIQVGPGPCTRTIFLKLWNPALCRSLIVRNVRLRTPRCHTRATALAATPEGAGKPKLGAPASTGCPKIHSWTMPFDGH